MQVEDEPKPVFNRKDEKSAMPKRWIALFPKNTSLFVKDDVTWTSNCHSEKLPTDSSSSAWKGTHSVRRSLPKLNGKKQVAPSNSVSAVIGDEALVKPKRMISIQNVEGCFKLERNSLTGLEDFQWRTSPHGSRMLSFKRKSRRLSLASPKRVAKHASDDEDYLFRLTHLKS